MTDTPNTPDRLIENMLRDAIEGDRAADVHVNDAVLLSACMHATVNAWLAAAAIHELKRVAPAAAAEYADLMGRMLTLGDIAGPAYRMAKKVGHDPDAWIAAFDERDLRRACRAADRVATTARTAALLEAADLAESDQIEDDPAGPLDAPFNRGMQYVADALRKLAAAPATEDGAR